MENLIDFRILEEPNFKDIIECIGDNPKQKRWKDHPYWGTQLLQFHATDNDLYIGAFDKDKLVGCMIAHKDQLQISRKIFDCAIIAITEVMQTYRKQGIASKMLDQMLKQLEFLNFDVVLAFQTAGQGGQNILKRVGFKKIHKYGHAIKILDKEVMESLLDLNPVLKKIAMKLLSSEIGEKTLPRGEIRLANDQDLDQIVELLNNRSNTITITNFWTKNDLKKSIDWRYKIYVLEVEGKILASVIRYEEISNLGENEFLCGFLKELAFEENIEEIEKEIFLYNLLEQFKNDKIPTVSYPTPKPWNEILKKTGFRVLPSDERTVFIKPLSDIAKQTIEQIEKFRHVNVFLIC